MKRRIFALLMALVLALACCPAGLAEETCTHEGTVFQRNFTTDVENRIVYPHGSQQHWYEWHSYAEEFCQQCGEVLDAHKLIKTMNSWEDHTFVDGVCSICGFDEKGQPIAPNEAMKKRFVFLGDKLPQADDLIHETSPQIRIDMFRPTIEFLLSLMSLKFGYGTRKYSFDTSGVVQTATQYIGERQDMMQELNRQRFQAAQYIRGIIRAALWFSHTFLGTACDLDEEIRIEFDDSYIEGKSERLEGMRQDALAGLGGAHVRALYLAEKYNLDDETAQAWAFVEEGDADGPEGA